MDPLHVIYQRLLVSVRVPADGAHKLLDVSVGREMPSQLRGARASLTTVHARVLVYPVVQLAVQRQSLARHERFGTDGATRRMLLLMSGCCTAKHRSIRQTE